MNKLMLMALGLLTLAGCTQADLHAGAGHSEAPAEAHAEAHADEQTDAKPAATAGHQAAGHLDMLGGVCEGFGPQTPRDIDAHQGSNPVHFALAPPASQMNLCNIHFHNAAEHKSGAFAVPAPMTADGHGGGFQCGISDSLTASEKQPFAGNQCQGIAPGDTIEVHWVHTTCDVDPGPGLGSCLSAKCANPGLRVETQVFTVVNDSRAPSFAELGTAARNAAGHYQGGRLPSGTGKPVQFLGSTTGPAYSQQVCSPLQVTWSVRPRCAKVDISSLSAWCADNQFAENHAHGVRSLVTDVRLLAPLH